MKQYFFITFAIIVVLSACSSAPADGTEAETASEVVSREPDSTSSEMGSETGMGRQGGMMARHHATIPDEYSGLSNPLSASSESLLRGEETYTAQCASCHGDGGMGDGPAGVGLDPVPAPIAHTTQMLGDNYLFWRISEGGLEAPFNSSMPSWDETLDEDSIWDVINYIQALGQGSVKPRQALGGEAYDPAAEATERAAMLSLAIEEGIITQSEAKQFDEVHDAMDSLMADGVEDMSGNMTDMRLELISELVKLAEISEQQATTFNDVHDRLIEAGLMQ